MFNKWDIVKEREKEAKERREDVAEDLPHLAFAPLVFVSALEGRGTHKILPLVDRVRKQQTQRIATSKLNQFLQAEASHHPPRAKGGQEVNLFYMAQVGTAPPRFVVFASKSKDVERTYTRYLARRLREEFGFEGTPIRVTLRKRRK